jgi:hypothetical protein
MGRGTRHYRADLLGALALVLVLAALALGLPALNNSLSSERPVRSDVPYRIADGVTVVPPRGALLDVTETRPSGAQGTVLFRIGPVRYLITAQRFNGDLGAAATRLRQRITGNRGYQVTGIQMAVATSTGLAGVQGGYTAPGRGGRYSVFVAGGRIVEITVSGADLDLGRTLPAIEDSTRTLRVEAVS